MRPHPQHSLLASSSAKIMRGRLYSNTPPNCLISPRATFLEVHERFRVNSLPNKKMNKKKNVALDYYGRLLLHTSPIQVPKNLSKGRSLQIGQRRNLNRKSWKHATTCHPCFRCSCGNTDTNVYELSVRTSRTIRPCKHVQVTTMSFNVSYTGTKQSIVSNAR